MAKGFVTYVFQQSLIWDAYGKPDTTKNPITISAKSEERARKKLPEPGMGRSWILLSKKAKG